MQCAFTSILEYTKQWQYNVKNYGKQISVKSATWFGLQNYTFNCTGLFFFFLVIRIKELTLINGRKEQLDLSNMHILKIIRGYMKPKIHYEHIFTLLLLA